MVSTLLRLVLAVGLCPLAPAATIIVVRHAERNAGMSADVLLNAKGEERAKQLAALLKDANLKAIFTTEVKRTQQTAEPAAQQFHLQPVVIPAADVDTLISRLKELPNDDTVLVVGHSNTVPLVIQKLGGTAAPLGENEYDRLTIVVTHGSQKPSVLVLRYGN